MINRLQATQIVSIKPLLSLLEQRFDIRIESTSASHLQSVLEHYAAKKEFIFQKFGAVESLAHPDYAKAHLISEAARLILREIDPRPTKKRKKIKGNPQ